MSARPGIAQSGPNVFCKSVELHDAIYNYVKDAVKTKTKWGEIEIPGFVVDYTFSVYPNLPLIKDVINTWGTYTTDLARYVNHRSRLVTIGDHATQINELKYHIEWIKLIYPTFSQFINRNKYKDAWIHFVEIMAKHFQPKINPWYADRETSILKGFHWDQLMLPQNKDIQDYVIHATELWYKNYIQAMHDEKYINQMPFNFGMRAREFTNFQLHNAYTSEIYKKARCPRTRIVMFKAGPSSGGCGCNCIDEDTHSRFVAEQMTTLKNSLGGTNVYGPIFSGAEAYAQYYDFKQEGWYSRALDGKRWESSVATILGYLSSGVSTKLSDRIFMEASGTIFTTDINTFAWLVILDTLHLLGSDNVKFFIHSDDLTILCKDPVLLDAIVKLICELGIAEEAILDTKYNFLLGICVHGKTVCMVGMKTSTDSPKHTKPAVLHRLIEQEYTDIEKKLVGQVYTGVLNGIPLIEYFRKPKFGSHSSIKYRIVEEAAKMTGYKDQIPHLKEYFN